ESFIGGRSSSAIGLVEALVEAGDVDEAMCRARIARGRALRRAARERGVTDRRQLEAFDAFLLARAQIEREAGDDWSLATDEQSRRRARREDQRRAAREILSSAFSPAEVVDSDCAALVPRADDEALLLLLPTRDDTLVFTASATGVRALRAPELPQRPADIDTWAQDLLHELRPQLHGIARLRVLPTGRTWSVPLHATMLDGAPLVEHMAVAYGLDLPATRVPELPDAPQVLLVADPTGDLPHARTEQDDIARQLADTSWTLDVRAGTATRRDDVLRRLAEVELFHYSGHGAHRGADGWDSALLLHGDASIEVADILALPRVPRTVVLAGCDTGAVDASLFDGGMSLGRAFLLAGSDAVIVGDREIGDEVTARFGALLYAAAAEQIFVAPELAVQGASRALLAGGVPVSQWSGFRVLVR
ncbi:MAG: CHAT domain-containing protein, partial [Deltaproteobacteria bacterium]|nr:CHAT domain-containing protein [Nannocystaceae bacterium]